MAYKEESQEIIDKMIEKQKERVPRDTHSSTNLMVPLDWMRDRFTTLRNLTEHESWRASTVGAKHDNTVKKINQFLKEPIIEQIEFVEFDLEEWKTVAKQIRDYTKSVKDKEIKANYHEYMTTVNSMFLAFMQKHHLSETTIEEWLERENTTEVDHRGRQRKRSSDTVSTNIGTTEGGLHKDDGRFRYH
ncbi:MAG: hypothetical protein CMF52_06215 [Legionellales bacterium]|nr:hypothetical protein [Legionellales bacterium]|tara:strand:+ start:118 stop:684 length:567 start_codon:yes stop_codon:yes gene_type:complete